MSSSIRFISAFVASLVAALPLAEGYTTTFRNFDQQTQRVRVRQLKVVGVESVTVPAGTFDAFKAEITSAEGEAITQWVAKRLAGRREDRRDDAADERRDDDVELQK